MCMNRFYQPSTIIASKASALHAKFAGARVKTKLSTRQPWLKLVYLNTDAH